MTYTFLAMLIQHKVEHVLNVNETFIEEEHACYSPPYQSRSTRSSLIPVGFFCSKSNYVEYPNANPTHVFVSPERSQLECLEESQFYTRHRCLPPASGESQQIDFAWQQSWRLISLLRLALGNSTETVAFLFWEFQLWPKDMTFTSISFISFKIAASTPRVANFFCDSISS